MSAVQVGTLPDRAAEPSLLPLKLDISPASSPSWLSQAVGLLHRMFKTPARHNARSRLPLSVHVHVHVNVHVHVIQTENLVFCLGRVCTLS